MLGKNVRLIIKKEFESHYMKLRGWSTVDLAREMRYPKQQISQTLNGKIEPSKGFLHRLCALTGLKAEELIETVFEK